MKIQQENSEQVDNFGFNLVGPWLQGDRSEYCSEVGAAAKSDKAVEKPTVSTTEAMLQMLELQKQEMKMQIQQIETERKEGTEQRWLEQIEKAEHRRQQ